MGEYEHFKWNACLLEKIMLQLQQTNNKENKNIYQACDYKACEWMVFLVGFDIYHWFKFAWSV